MRTVVHIEERVGPRGGKYWWLTLECGHFAMRSRPSVRRVLAVRIMSRPAYAPRRMKCRVCEGGKRYQ